MIKKEKYEKFGKAPIILAILQFRYQKIEEFDSKKIKEIGAEIKKEFPIVNERIQQTVRLDGTDKIGETKILIDSREIDGVRFLSEDKTKTLVVGVSNFTLEIHGEYPGWDKFKEEGQRLWNLFKPYLGVENLDGLSLRFVNRINLPINTEDISNYFTTFINSNTGNHSLNQFQLRYTSSENNIIMHVAHALESPIEATLPYLFDIDVIYSGEVSNDDSKIWKIFEDLRDKKNFIFNDGLTEEAKKIIR